MNEDEWEKINEYYRKNPPQAIFDDLGIHHEVEVPLPAKYVKMPCSCGIIHKWEIPGTFYICTFIKCGYNSHPNKAVKKCSTCHDILMLKLYKNSPPPTDTREGIL